MAERKRARRDWRMTDSLSGERATHPSAPDESKIPGFPGFLLKQLGLLEESRGEPRAIETRPFFQARVSGAIPWGGSETRRQRSKPVR